MKTLRLGLAAALILVLAPPAPASHRPSSFCSESGDICVRTTNVDGVRKFKLGMAAKYFDHYTLCVNGPEGKNECKAFVVVKRHNRTFGDSVRWSRHFPNEGAGAYTVTWEADGYQPPRLGFHVSR